MIRVNADTNKIATVFGKKNIEEYLKKEIQKGNLVRIKNRSNPVSERTVPITAGYNKNTSATDNIPQTDTESQEIRLTVTRTRFAVPRHCRVCFAN